MEAYKNLNRFSEYYKYETRLHQPYEYRTKGLLKRLISPTLANTKNTLTQRMLTFIESSILFMLSGVDLFVKQHNWTTHNR